MMSFFRVSETSNFAEQKLLKAAPKLYPIPSMTIHGTIVYSPTWIVDFLWKKLVGKYTTRPIRRLVMGMTPDSRSESKRGNFPWLGLSGFCLEESSKNATLPKL